MGEQLSRRDEPSTLAQFVKQSQGSFVRLGLGFRGLRFCFGGCRRRLARWCLSLSVGSGRRLTRWCLSLSVGSGRRLARRCLTLSAGSGRRLARWCLSLSAGSCRRLAWVVGSFRRLARWRLTLSAGSGCGFVGWRCARPWMGFLGKQRGIRVQGENQASKQHEPTNETNRHG